MRAIRFLTLAVFLGALAASLPATAGSILTQGALNAELGTSCAAQGKTAPCLTPAQMSDLIATSVPLASTGITAAGTSQGTATVLSGQINLVTTVAAGTGVELPPTVAGQVVYVINGGANPLAVYPPPGVAINGLAANTPVTVPIGATKAFVASSGTAVNSNPVPGWLAVAKTGNYTVTSSDGQTLFSYTCATATCTIMLPSTGLFSPGGGIVVSNVSNQTAVPILPVGTPVAAGSCSAGACSGSSTTPYTVIAQHDLIVVEPLVCGGTLCATAPTPTVSSITDTFGNSCSFVGGQSSSSANLRAEIWVCPNTNASTGADIFTVTYSGGTQYYGYNIISEYSGAALSSVAEVSAGGAGNSAAPSLTTSAAPSLRGDLIIGNLNVQGAPAVTLGQTGIAVGGSFGPLAQYLRTSGSAAGGYKLNWTFSVASNYAAVVAALKPAHPTSLVLLCGPSGVGAFYGSPTYIPASNPCVPLVPGASAAVAQDSSGNYSVTLSPPGQGIGIDDVTASATLSLPHCYETLDVMSWVGSAPTLTVPTGLPIGCIVNLFQEGPQAAAISPASGMAVLGSNAHTGGTATAAFLQIGGGGKILFGGVTAP